MRSVNSVRVLMAMVLITFCMTLAVGQIHAQKLGHGLIVVSPNKMPVETRQPSVAMTLHLVDPQTLYLYVEEQDVRKLAVYDVTDPGKIKLKKIAQLDTTGTYEHLTQSAITRRIQNREESLGVSLFDRQSRPIQLTAAGRATYESAKPVLCSVGNLRSAVVHQGETSGSFRFGPE